MNREKNELSLREIQLEELAILLKVRDFFNANGIRYMLCGGTLLGAVRHGGFIPWDDDIDVILPRTDFEKLIDIVRERRPLLDGAVFRLPGDEGYIYPYIKAVNPSIRVDYGKTQDNMLWIDIFSLDHFPDNKLMHWYYLQKLITLERALSMGTFTDDHMRLRGYYSSITKRIKMCIARSLYRLFGGYKGVSERIGRIASDMNKKYQASRHLGGSLWPNGMHDYYRSESVETSVSLKFEGHDFDVPGDYDTFLRDFFGDYMTLPPEDKRQSHYIKAYRI